MHLPHLSIGFAAFSFLCVSAVSAIPAGPAGQIGQTAPDPDPFDAPMTQNEGMTRPDTSRRDEKFIDLEALSLSRLDQAAREHKLTGYLKGAIVHVRNPGFYMSDFTWDRYRRIMTASIRVLRAMAMAEGARWIQDHLAGISDVYLTQIGLERDAEGALKWTPVPDSPLLGSKLLRNLDLVETIDSLEVLGDEELYEAAVSHRLDRFRDTALANAGDTSLIKWRTKGRYAPQVRAQTVRVLKAFIRAYGLDFVRHYLTSEGQGRRDKIQRSYMMALGITKDSQGNVKILDQTDDPSPKLPNPKIIPDLPRAPAPAPPSSNNVQAITGLARMTSEQLNLAVRRHQLNDLVVPALQVVWVLPMDTDIRRSLSRYNVGRRLLVKQQSFRLLRAIVRNHGEKWLTQFPGVEALRPEALEELGLMRVDGQVVAASLTSTPRLRALPVLE